MRPFTVCPEPRDIRTGVRYDGVMRWGSQRVDGGEASGQLALFERDQVVPRTFSTPEFDGMTFYEVQAKKVINRVPAASRVGFDWTINPYRGCGHACVYCLDPSTPVRRADGSEVPIERLSSGDPIVGTVPGATGRHYVITHVLDVWESVQPAYRVELADGRELVASPDHRFLATDGWRYVSPAGDEPAIRPGVELVVSGLPTGSPVVDVAGQRLPEGARVAVRSVESLKKELRMVDIMTGTQDFIANGVVSHNCFARRTHEYLDLNSGPDFDSKIVVKVNTPQRLRSELVGHTGEHIAMGTNVDCYQRAEGRYRLMPGIIEALRDWRNPFSILTKGTLILRDLPLLRQAREVTDVGLAVSIGFTDHRLWRSVEPGTPSPRARLGVVRALTEAGFDVSVLMAPILPFLTDSEQQLAESVRAITQAGARRITPIVLHLRPGARQWYFAWLQREYPHLVRPYEQMYAAGAYAPDEYCRRIQDMVRRCGPGRHSG